MLHACTPTGAEARRTGPGGLIGRTTELTGIEAALGAARSGRGGALLVTGEPGAGRTRLAAEAASAAVAAGMATARGRTRSLGPALPYGPLAEALLALGRPAADGGTAWRHDPLLAPLLDGEPVPPLAVAETILRRLAQAGADGRGALLVLDDLHEADPGTLAVVEHLLDPLAGLPALLLATLPYGAGAAATLPYGAGAATSPATALAERARRRGSAVLLGLRPLRGPEVRLLLADGLGADPASLGRDLVDRAVEVSGGLPATVREMAADLASRTAPGEVPEAAAVRLPPAVAESLRQRAAALGPLGPVLLGTAALFGDRFPAPAVRHALTAPAGDGRHPADAPVTGPLTGPDGGPGAGPSPSAVDTALSAAVAAGLIVPDPADPGWYGFRPRLAAEAFRDGLGPAGRTTYARRAAAALSALHPGLPGAWCARAAALRARAGDLPEAVRGYRTGAARAAAEGAVDHALDLLDRALRLTASGAAAAWRADVLDDLLDTVARSARFDRLPRLTAAVDALGDHGVPAPRRAGPYARLAGIAALRGRPEEALRHLDVARWLLGSSPSESERAPVELAAARVARGRPVREGHGPARESARRAAESALRAGLPALACDALLLLGELCRDHDEPASVRRTEEARVLADAHRLPLHRLAAEVQAARLAAGRDGRPARVEQARREALRTGAPPLAHAAGLDLALDRVRRGADDAARELIAEDLASAGRLGLGRDMALLTLAEAVRHAHRGRADAMEEALERLDPLLAGAPDVRPMAYGLARGFCALLEERHEAAAGAFVRALACAEETPAAGDFGRLGPVRLVAVVTGRFAVGRAGGDGPSRGVPGGDAGGRWNAVFGGLADAVLLGRAGRTAEAGAAADAALAASEPYPLARHLGLRLVARAAYEDGWGSPARWLTEAEEYAHGAGLPATAAACRALLRGMGAPVRQRRTGRERVPSELRRQGITVREFEVARLLAERIGNKDIAGRLHISPRTVEKHVASLLQKTGHPNRAAFATATRELVGGARG